MESMAINYPHGTMVIHLERFFPCSQDRAKKLLKIISEDKEHAQDLLMECLDYCIQLTGQRSNDKDYFEGEYTLTRTDRESLDLRIREGKEADGMPLSYTKAKEYTDRKRSLKAKEDRLERNYKQAVRDIKMLTGNIENIKKFMAAKGW